MEIIKGVKKKQAPNPTNWQFASHPKCQQIGDDKLPALVSLKENFPPVYTQIYGNCTSNAVLACDAYYYHNDKWMPSTVFTYWNQRKLDDSGFDQDDGSFVETALDAVRKKGACNAKIWANTEPWNKKPSEEAFKNGLHGHELSNYYNIKSLLQLKKALAAGYPVVASISWCFESMSKDFVLSHVSKEDANNCEMGHAIVIVGYDNTKELVEIRNSWGPAWGNNGYAYISYKTLKNIIWWDDTYAVVK